jgi:beta-lactamase superfamily II metal-dependent hydrolase
MRAIVVILGLLVPACLLCAQPRTLDIYWVDVEGGAATLIVTPAGESLLVDTGYPGDRDARRVYDVATKQAALKKIDNLLITHYHTDHVGGVGVLSKLIPIGKFYDHGEAVSTRDPEDARNWETYKTVAAGKRTILKPGDEIPLKGVTIQVLSAGGELLAQPLKGAGANNPYCQDAPQKPEDKSENGQSVGFLLTDGRFKFLDMGDLTWSREMQLACPANKIGAVTVFQASHHGFFNNLSGAPPFVWAVDPQVVVVNNGPQKGWLAPAYDIAKKIPGLEDIWQGHLSLATDKDHNADEKMIANLDASDDCKGNWIKLSVEPDGKFTILNGRNRFSKTYTAR